MSLLLALAWSIVTARRIVESRVLAPKWGCCDYRSALAQYDAAIGHDPNFAAAHAARAKVIVVITSSYARASELKPAYADALPLVFDDAFTNSDCERLVGLRRMLARGIHQGIQIVLLTCHPDNYTALLAEHVVSAPGQHCGQKNPPEVIGGVAEAIDWDESRMMVKLD